MVRNILILLAPEEIGGLFGKNVPPLALGVLKSFLEENNYYTTIHDLSSEFGTNFIKTERIRFVKKILDKEFFFEQMKVSKIDDPWVAELEMFVHNIDFFNYDTIAISTGSGMSLFEIHFSFLLAKYIKLKYNKPLVFGGININYIYTFQNIFKELWNEILNNFNYIFKGPGEVSLVKLLNAISEGTDSHIYKELDGAIYVNDNVLIANTEAKPAFSVPNFDGLNLNTYTTCIDLENHDTNLKYHYQYPFPFGIIASNHVRVNSQVNSETLFIPYIFNFYCPYNCAFCEQSEDIKKKPLSKPADIVVNDIKYLMNKYKTKYFYFFNNTFNYNKQFVNDFCSLVIEQGLEFYWSDCARVNGLDKESLQRMYQAGCRKLIFGFETGSPKLLKYIDKKLNIEDLLQVLNWCKEIGISGEVEVIVGFPYEYDHDFDLTYKILNEQRAIINFFYPNRYFVWPSSLIGSFPERYRIKLFPGKDYDSLLNSNKELVENKYFSKKNTEGINNFHIYYFDEIEGRNHAEILQQTTLKFNKMITLQRSYSILKEASSIFEL